MTESDLNASIEIKNDPPRMRRPDSIAARTVLTFLRAVFDENYQKGNWHLDPEKEMYIRRSFPENVKEVGIKPGIVLGNQGGIRQGARGLGELNYIPMDTQRVQTLYGDDEIFSGNMNLKAISPVNIESKDIAYRAMISINKFGQHLMGVNGMFHVHCLGYQDTVPEDVSSEIKIWATPVMVEYVIRVPYVSSIMGDRLERIHANAGNIEREE